GGQEVGIEQGEEVADDLVIGAERALQEGGAGEDDEADAFAGGVFEQALGEQAGAVEAAGLDVVGEHRAGEVDGDDDLAGLVEDGFLQASPLRAGEGDGGAGEAEAKPPAGAGASGGVGRGEGESAGAGVGGEDLAAGGRTRRAAREVQREEEDGEGGEPKEPGVEKAHGVVMAVGRVASPARSRKAAPGMANQAKYSSVMRVDLASNSIFSFWSMAAKARSTVLASAARK